MKPKLFFISLLFTAVTISSQTKDPVLMTINGNPVMKSEFEYIYNKNNSNNSLDKKTLDEYVDLFVNFKLKVEEAKAQGIDTTKSFINELAGYRSQLTKPYLTDSKVDEEVLREAYNRMKEDVDVSHILIRVQQGASPADTLAAWNKIKNIQKRLSKEDALDLIKNASLLDLAKMASAKKDELHKEKLTTFIVDRNINYTNVCWVDCKFCAFFRHKKDSDSYVLKFDEIDEKIEELLAIGGTQILFQGGVHPNLKIDYYEELVNHIHTKYPQITIHGFSSIEIDFIAKVSKISILEVLKRLQAKGLSSIPGAGAEILSDRVRDIIAPKKMK